MPLLSISANDIDVSGLSLDVPLPPSWLTATLADADVTPTAPGHLTVRLSRSGSDVVVRGRVRASVSTPCARCLGPTPVDVDAELSLLLRPEPKADARPPARGKDAASHNGVAKKGAPAKEPEYEFTAEEADVDTYDGEKVVLDPFVREAILLEMPNFPLCSEACPGIGPAASAGGSKALADAEGEADEAAPPGIDPRLAPLGALRDKLGTKPSEGEKPSQKSSSSPGKPGTPKKKTKKE